MNLAQKKSVFTYGLFPEVNLALMKPVFASPAHPSGSASNAVDGNP